MAIPPMIQHVVDDVGCINEPDLSAIREMIDIAESICQRIGITRSTPSVAAQDPPFTLANDFLHFPLAAPIKPQLVDIGLPYNTIEKLSEVYMRQVEALKVTSEQIARATCLQLASLPQVNDTMPLETIQRREAIALAHNHVTVCHNTLAQDLAPETVKNSQKKPRRPFKTEYLPLFEFAFQRDHFPSREDKNHLARISGMSFHQVTNWFQNRRCRQASRAQSTRTTASPRTFEEMREHLGDSSEEWTKDALYLLARDHDCMFAVEKFGLMGLTRRREKDPTRPRKNRPITRPSIRIGWHVIKPTERHKFLGVIMDQELRFRQQVHHALMKGDAYINQYKRLTKQTKGTTAKHMRKYYLAVAIPRMLYAADIFLIPEYEHTKGTQGHINKLAQVQRQAALTITGAMRTTATDTLDAHANLLLFPLLVTKVIHRAVT
ncbi:hypothetical protein JB92DRAFT_3108284 [Gautieria morchelliformis]|nr:hypothetical protein JB92DRAFT_3108284 [Gautieria morchelliformis]